MSPLKTSGPLSRDWSKTIPHRKPMPGHRERLEAQAEAGIEDSIRNLNEAAKAHAAKPKT